MANSSVKSQYKQIARLILAGATTRAYYVRQGGYDNHAMNTTYQPILLGEFSESVDRVPILHFKNKSCA